ncbi:MULTISPECIES: histidinol-phosphatase HisJ [Bacillales]|uniref:Histidinol-phosphatase n=1 Tax=Lysinibacillus louembei TaxID=1470088 RepID=A0ABZ0RQV6_9BACI|nr:MULTISPECIES: histidinol-phosphatase HisJ [Bacillales]MCT6925608.1 histidinol-phosphatase HisJ [Metasolibacillus sp.]MCT6941763.1 histidinol-phosphatase HisJ [Metasolibacillus sp.]WPK10614.1 histidinol-phosphatase HisJ [Lysinibacillus louembei]
MKKDGHIHTPFCPHGSKDALEHYVEKAIACHFSEITFTEHAPLPPSFDEPTPDKDGGMDLALLPSYFTQLQQIKKYYSSQIRINIGLEVDFIAGFEHETRQFLNEYGPLLDDSILSVHFLKWQNRYTCIDFSKEVYLQYAEQLGSVQRLYQLYYETVHQSIDSDLGKYKPKRIGHPTLIHKFQHAHGEQIDDIAQIKKLMLHMQSAGYEMDFNSAGLSKPLCLEPYPPLATLEYAHSIGLRYTFGSDAHTVQDLHQHYDLLFS